MINIELRNLIPGILNFKLQVWRSISKFDTTDKILSNYYVIYQNKGQDNQQSSSLLKKRVWHNLKGGGELLGLH